VIYGVEASSQQVAAAVAFHVDVDETRPIEVTALGIRTDGALPRADSVAVVRWLLAYLAEASLKDGRPGLVAVWLEKSENDSDYVALGFRPSKKPPGSSGSPGRYLVLESGSPST